MSSDAADPGKKNGWMYRIETSRGNEYLRRSNEAAAFWQDRGATVTVVSGWGDE